MQMANRFSASFLLNPLFPDTILFQEKGISFTVRKLFSSNEHFVFYGDTAGVEIQAGIFFADISIKAKAREEQIIIRNFTKSDARRVKDLILEKSPN